MIKSVVKAHSSTVEPPLILVGLSTGEAGGIYGVAVKCIDMVKNSNCEGSRLGQH